MRNRRVRAGHGHDLLMLRALVAVYLLLAVVHAVVAVHDSVTWHGGFAAGCALVALVLENARRDWTVARLPEAATACARRPTVR